MARYKPVDRHLMKLLPVRFSEQILPGTLEYAVHWRVDHPIDLSVFAARDRNDETGATAYAPAVLLKVVLLGYARGLISSRAIEGACRENVVFMALSGDSAPTSPPSPRSLPSGRRRSLPSSETCCWSAVPRD